MTRAHPATMMRLLGLRLAAAALAVSLGLLGFFFVKYMLDTPTLRRTTLDAQVAAIHAALAGGADPAALFPYRLYPNDYGFRVLQQQPNGELRVTQEFNPALLPPLPSDEAGGAAREGADTMLSEGFFDLGAAAQSAGKSDHWMLSDISLVDRHNIWIQVAMAGDPAWLWRDIIARELIDHVVLPVGVAAPLMALAVFLTARRALRPLVDVADQAQALGRAVRAGQTLQALPVENLPKEVFEVIVAINAMIARLETSLRQQKQFTADVAHELRTPLAVLRLQIAELPESGAVAQIKSEIDGLAMLIVQLLRFARAEEAMLAAPQPVDLCLVCRKVCEDLARVAVQRNLIIEYDPQDRPMKIMGNAQLIDVAVRNIAENALNASDPGGAIQVSVDPQGVVRVDDRGPGVKDLLKSDIFQRFRRGEGSRGEGSGIGLALVRRIVELHGGQVSVEDRPGGGASFVLNFAGRGA